MDFEVVVGTYEEILLGFRVIQVGENFQLEPSFTDHSHSGCIKHVAVSAKGMLASGGTDETIQLFNLRNRSQLGSLTHHSGSVTCLQFYKKSHLFSTSEDGTFCIWKTYSWECLKTLRGHKGPVLSLSVHPSGKLALTVGQDKTLRTWNLITGKSAYISNIKKVADIVSWSPSGAFYAVVFANKVDVYKLETASVCSSWTFEKKINSFTFVNDSIVVYGGEGGLISFYDINTNTEISSVDAEVNRIRGISLVESSGSDEDKYYMFTASSDGFLKMFSVVVEGTKVNVKCLSSHNADFRLTCVTVMRPRTSVKEEIPDVSVNTDSVVEDRLSEQEEDTEQIANKKSPKQKTDKKLKQSKKEKAVKRLGKEQPLKRKVKKIKKENEDT